MIDIEAISNSIKQVYNNAIKIPAKDVSSIILATALPQRQGLSAVVSTANIINELSKRGIPTEDLPDGTPNKMNALVYSIVSEVYRAIKEDVNVQVTIPPSAINVVANGGNAGGPVVANGFNINYGKGNALIQ